MYYIYIKHTQYRPKQPIMFCEMSRGTAWPPMSLGSLALLGAPTYSAAGGTACA